MKRTFKNFDEYSEYYENREHKMNDVDVVENTVTVCADGEFECKNWKTAVRRFFKEINDNSLFDGWKECITECVENGIWKEKEEYNGKHVCGGWFWEVECIDEGYWYVSLTVSKEIEEESESAETVESVETKEKNTMTKGEIRHELAKAKKELKDAWICGEGYEYDQNFIVCYKDGTVLETREANERLPQTGIIGIQFFGTDGHYTVGYEMYNGEKVLIEDESEDACYRVEYLPLTSTEATAETVESVEETTVSETETVEETAEQETELNAEVEAEQTEENNIPHTVNRGRKSKGDISMNHFESDKYNSPFAVRFRELCKDTATAAKLRQYLGVTSQTISQFKLGTTLPKTENLIRIADFFNVSVDYLLGRTNTASQDVTIQAVCSTTGLSQAAVEKLALWTSDDDKRKLWTDYLSYYITSPDFEKALEYINKAHNCYNGDLNEDVIVKLWQVSRKIEVVTESLIELEEIPKTGYFDTS